MLQYLSGTFEKRAAFNCKYKLKPKWTFKLFQLIQDVGEIQMMQSAVYCKFSNVAATLVMIKVGPGMSKVVQRKDYFCYFRHEFTKLKNSQFYTFPHGLYSALVGS